MILASRSEIAEAIYMKLCFSQGEIANEFLHGMARMYGLCGGDLTTFWDANDDANNRYRAAAYEASQEMMAAQRAARRG